MRPTKQNKRCHPRMGHNGQFGGVVVEQIVAQGEWGPQSLEEDEPR